MQRQVSSSEVLNFSCIVGLAKAVAAYVILDEPVPATHKGLGITFYDPSLPERGWFSRGCKPAPTQTIYDNGGSLFYPHRSVPVSHPEMSPNSNESGFVYSCHSKPSRGYVRPPDDLAPHHVLNIHAMRRETSSRGDAGSGLGFVLRHGAAQKSLVLFPYSKIALKTGQP